MTDSKLHASLGHGRRTRRGVFVKEQDLKSTTHVFTLADGSEVSLKGDEQVEYDGELHTAANLFDALKEGYYGKL